MTCGTRSAASASRSGTSKSYASFMGHASITTTAIYLHRKPAPDDADRLSRLVSVSQAISRNAEIGRNGAHLGAPENGLDKPSALPA